MPREFKTILWNSEEGRRRLFESQYHRAFFALAHVYQPQLTPTHCGVASAVIVLNAFRSGTSLRIDSKLCLRKPPALGGGGMRFNAYSQLTFLDRATDKVKPRHQVKGVYDPACPEGGGFNPGLALVELAAKLRLHLLKVVLRRAVAIDAAALKKFRHDVMAFTNDPDVYIIANYDGRMLGNKSEGHFSPVAAYHKPTDSCLVLDVAGHKHPWFWVSVKDLYRAMHTKDGKRYRGYLLVSDKLRSL